MQRNIASLITFFLLATACDPCAGDRFLTGLLNRPFACGGEEPSPASPPAADPVPVDTPVTPPPVVVEECYFSGPELPVGPARSLAVTQCLNPIIRGEEGGSQHGWREIPVDVVTARTPATGDAVRANDAVVTDFATLNQVFESAQIRFVLNSYTVSSSLPFDASEGTARGHWSNSDNLWLVYVNSIDIDNQPTGGYTQTDRGVLWAPGNTNWRTLIHEFGHLLGLRHTFDCVVNSEHDGDQNYNGDEISDTPYDPGRTDPITGVGPVCYQAPAGVDAGTYGHAAGTCALLPCPQTCADGSQPDMSNFMSYYDNCRDHFSPEQILLMRCLIRSEMSDRARCTSGTECSDETPGGTSTVESCVDTSLDEQHCGSCENRCPGRTQCVGGVCTPGRADEACERACTEELDSCNATCARGHGDSGCLGRCRDQHTVCHNQCLR